MANEQRLIDANEHHAKLSKMLMDELFPDWKELPRDVQEKLSKLGKEHERLLFEAPTVDAVEVVRCDNCVNHGKCLPENVFRIARIESPYCCVGKMDGERKE